MVAAAVGPTPFWYATRGSGYAALVLLSAVIVLGLLMSARWHSPSWPRFLTQELHRNLSLLTVVFLGIHVATSTVDPFAGLSVRDAVVPFAAGYRPLWLGLGVIDLELFVAIVVTSLVRHRLGWRAWQAAHLLSYVAWPVAMLHTIGTGTDTRAAWTASGPLQPGWARAAGTPANLLSPTPTTSSDQSP